MTKNRSLPPLSPVRRAGDMVFISGQLPRQDDGTMRKGDIEAQTRQVIANLRKQLETQGLDLADVVKTTVWLTDGKLAPAFNAVYRETFPEPYPARTTVVSGLVADADIELEAIATTRGAASA